MKLVILNESLLEFIEAVDYYEVQQSGLGRRLKEEIEWHLNWVKEFPLVPPVRKGGYRRVNLKVFPYYIAYTIKFETIWILAIAHMHRKPDYWVRRKKQIQ